ncbi:hypothetical protein V5799_014761 [Amblyomma americanum]|uniref:Uncharacterized protein n=1 Tax=Amblyomma americanum TaxID=6943 RepID=A0AAQ4E232_AMBAM
MRPPIWFQRQVPPQAVVENSEATGASTSQLKTAVNFSIKALVAARTQTEPPAMLPAPLSPIPPGFRAQGASTPQEQEAASVVSETVDSFDWDGGVQPAAEHDITYMPSFDTSFGRQTSRCQAFLPDGEARHQALV